MDIKDFDEASNHPYECQCLICIEWWKEVGPECEEDFDDSAPIFALVLTVISI